MIIHWFTCFFCRWGTDEVESLLPKVISHRGGLWVGSTSHKAEQPGSPCQLRRVGASLRVVLSRVQAQRGHRTALLTSLGVPCFADCRARGL